MALRLITGRAGTGKSYYIYNEIHKHILKARRREKLILLVPEQYTLQAERDFMEKTGLQGIMQLEVLSFTRLAQRIFNEVGGMTRVMLNEQGKSMVLRRVMEQLEGQLQVYHKSCRQDGFVQDLVDFLAGLKQRAVGVDNIRQMQDSIEKGCLLERKLHDITLIYQYFDAYLQERYIDGEDYINLFIEKMPLSRYLSNSRIWVDNFATFSPQSIRILEQLITVCPEITISLSLNDDKAPRDEELFILSRKAYHAFNEIARNNGIDIHTVNIDASAAAQRRDIELLHLERELYAYPSHKYLDAVSCISVFAAANPDSEVEYLAARLISLVRDAGYRWKDIAVICGSLDSYSALIKRVFKEYGIPYFMDQKKDIMDNPIIEFILSSLRGIERGYLYEDVFRGLKTGLGVLDEEACEKLENYVLANGIRGNRWRAPFTCKEEKEQKELNLWRETVINPLAEMKMALKEKEDFAGITQVLYDYLEKQKVQEKLQGWIEEFQEQGLYEVIGEYTQIWNKVIDTFDQMVEILGDQQGSLTDYIKVLEAGFAAHELGIIPTTVDQVLVGDIQRSKSHDIKALFILGVNDGLIPASKARGNILSADESDYLASQGMEISKFREMQIAEENFLIYNAMAKCRQNLFLSYATADSEGRALRPSLLLERFRYLYPGLQVVSGLINNRQRQLQLVARPQSTFKHLIENLRLHLDNKAIEDFWWDVYNWYRGQEDWQEHCLNMEKALFHRNQVERLSPGLVRQLYRLPLRGSVTRLERFVACPFAHFVHYGLSPQERKEFSVKAPDIGELFHNSLLELALQIEKRPGKWQGIEREECNSLMDTVMDKMLNEQGKGVFFSNNRYRYLSQRLKRIGRRTAWIVTEHIKGGGFTPLAYEIKFGAGGNLPALTIELDNGGTMYLEGRIDRVDILDQGDSGYVRIIDYKTGNKQLNIADTYYGLNLQLLIYLRAVLAGARQLEGLALKPAGIFYFKIDDPLVETTSDVKEVIEQQLKKQLKLRGLALKDVDIVKAMDRQIGSSSDIIPVGLNKDETFNAYSAVLSEEDFQYLLNHVDNLLRRVCQEMVGGKVKIEPYKLGEQIACTFCPYLSICQFDRQLPGNNYRQLVPIKDNEAIRIIRSQQEVDIK